MSAKTKSDRLYRVEVLEPRLLLAADWLAGIVPVWTGDAEAQVAPVDFQDLIVSSGDKQAQQVASTALPASLDLNALVGLPSWDDGSDPVALPQSSQQDGATLRHELVVIDAGIAGFEALVADIDSRNGGHVRYDIHILDATADGVLALSALLAGYTDLDALHLVSHGDDGGIRLGDTRLDGTSISGYADAVRGWSDALNENGDLLVYGCDLAASDGGVELIESLAALTQADVAASDDLTGQARLGGDWHFEYRLGDIDTKVAFSAQMQNSWTNVLATFTVNTLNDTVDANPGDGLALDAAGNTSLRAAIMEANALGGADVISLPAGNYLLSIAGEDNNANAGDLDITDALTIAGAGSGTTTIDAQGIDRVLHSLTTGVVINDVTLTGGVAVGAFPEGGALHVETSADATLERVVITGNSAQDGGGLFSNGTLTLRDVTVDANSAAQNGGGVRIGGSADLQGVTVSNNLSGSNGAGVFVNSGASATLTNVTVSGNDAAISGGGLRVLGSATLLNVTVADNTAGNMGGGVSFAGGVSNVTASNSIFTDNTAISGGNDYNGAVTSDGTNLIRDSVGSTGFAPAEVADPLLDLSLRDNGGLSLTHALLAGSPAIDAGTAAGAPSTDQRGFMRLGTADIGATEYGTLANGMPVAVNDAYAAPAGSPLTIDAIAGLLANDADPDFDPLLVRLLSGPANGSLTLNPVGVDGDFNVSSDPANEQKPEWSPDGTQIVFHSNRDGNNEIYVVNADGTGLTRLTTNAANDRYATWSPDGSQIAFRSDRAGTDDIWVMDADGSNPLRLTTGAAADVAIDRDPNWSADGSKIVFVSDRDGNLEIYIMDADGSNPVRLTNDAELDIAPSISADGSRIAFVSNRDGNNEIYVMDADGGNPTRLTNDAGTDRGPTWSPDGSKLLFHSNRDGDEELFVMDADGSNPVQLTFNNAADRAPDWSSDGTQIVFRTDRDTDNEIYTVQILSDGAFSYTPNAGFTGVDTFTYEATDGALDAGPATVTLTVADIGMAIWTEGGLTTPQFSAWDGTGFAPEGNSAPVGEYRTMQAADAPTRNEIIVVGVDEGSNLSGEIWNGTSWSALPFNDFATVSASFPQGVDVAYESVSGDAMLVWNNGTDISYRIWDGVSWSAEFTVAVPRVGEPKVMELTASPMSDEIILSVTNTGEEDYVLVWDGDSWIDTRVLTATASAADNGRDPWVAYESQSGQAMIVYGNNSTVVRYRLWDGASWSAESVLSPPGGVTGIVNWTKLASDPTSDRLALAVYTANSEVWLAVWDGASSWDVQLATTAAPSPDFPNMDVAFETTTGEALAVYAETTSPDNELRYRVWNGAWSGELAGPDIGSLANTVLLEAAPNSDGIMLAAQNDDSELNFVLWNGTAWGAVNLVETDTGEVNNEPFAFVWHQPTTVTQSSAPSATNLTQVHNFFEDVAAVALTDIVVSDPDATDTITATLTIADAAAGALTAASGNGETYTSGTGVWTITGTVAQVNAALVDVAFIPTADYASDTTILTHIEDLAGSGPADGLITLDVTPVNDQPSFNTLGNQTVLEDSGPHKVIGFATALPGGGTDESGQTFTYTVSSDNPALFLVGPAIDASGTLTYTLNPDATGTARVTVSVTDSGGTANGGVDTSADQTFDIVVDPSASVDVTVASPTDSTTEDIDLVFSVAGGNAITVGDGTPADPVLRAALKVTNGVLTLASTAGLTTVTGDGTDTVIVIGTESAINAALDGLTYSPTAGYTGAASLQVTIDVQADLLGYYDFTQTSLLGHDSSPAGGNDGTASGPGSAPDPYAVFDAERNGDVLMLDGVDDNLVVSGRFGTPTNVTLAAWVNVAAVNDQEVISIGGSMALRLNDSNNGSGVTGFFNDGSSWNHTDSAQFIGGDGWHHVAFTFDDANNTQVIYIDGIALGTTNYSGSINWAHQLNTVIGSHADSNGYWLDGMLDDVRVYDRALSLAEIQAIAIDQSSDTEVISITVDPGNSAPILADDSPGLTAIDEDDFTSSGDSVAAIVIDGSITDPDGAAVESIAITAVDDSNGTWQYSTDDGATWNDVDDGSLGVDHALLLDGTLVGVDTQRLRFVPDADFSGSPEITFRAWDMSGGVAGTYADTTSSGGTSPFSTDTDTASIDVSAVNDAPSFSTLGDQNVLEDSGPHTVAGFATALPGGGTDESGQTFTYAVSSDNPGLFLVGPAIDASGTLTYTLNANVNGTATVTLSVRDSGGTANGGIDTSADQTFDIFVGAVNDAPSFSTLGDQNVLEDSGPHTVAGFATALPGGGTDESGQTFTYAVSSDNPGLFLVGPAIDASGTLTYTLNANVNGTATVTLSVRDSGGTANGGIDTSADQTFDIFVGAVNDAPSFSTLGDQNVLEDSGPHTVAGFATALPGGGTDESGQTFTYAVSSDNPGLFLVGPAIDASGTLTYTLNANVNGTATVTLSVRDSGGTANGGIDTSADQTFDIVVGAVNDAPSFSTLGDQNVLEDSGPHTVAGFATALPGGGTDESGQTFTYAVSSDNPGLFLVGPAIDASGTLTYTLNPNLNGTATVTVSVRDSGGTGNGGVDTSADQTFDIVVAPVNDAPIFSTLGDQLVLENSGSHTVVGFATAQPGGDSDESGQSLTYTLSSNNPVLFLDQPEIDENGTLTYTLNPNVNGVARITVFVTDDGGTADGGVNTSTSQSFDIIVGNVGDEPTLLLSTDGNEGGDDTPGLDSWSDDSVLGFGDPAFAFGPGAATSGVFTLVFDLDPFGDSKNIDGLHYVSNTVTVGSGGAGTEFTLLPGDLLLSVEGGGNYTYTGLTTTITVQGSDVFVFRPQAPGDYSNGEFYYLLDNALGDDIHGIALVESASVQVGDGPPLVQGTFLLSEDGSGEQDNVYTYLAQTIGDGTTISLAGKEILIDGEDSGDLSYTDRIHGIHLIEEDSTIGGMNFLAGDLLLTLDKDQTNPANGVGTTNLEVDEHDVFRLRLSETQQGPNGRSIGEAVVVFDGSSVGLDSGGEDIDALTLLRPAPNAAPTATNLTQTQSYLEDAASVTLDDIVVTDGDAGDTITARLVLSDVSAGALTAGSGNGESYNAVSGLWTITGTLAQVNAALADVAFVPASNSVANTTVTTHIEDLKGSGPADGLITLNATPVNDAPSFSTLGDQTVLEDSGPHTVAGFATALPGGGTDESGQTFTYTVSSDNPGLFLVGPAIDASGTLTYTLNANINGTATVTLSVRDSGGTADGGVDASADQTFDIVVGAVNDAPSFSTLGDQTVLEDSGPHTVAGFASALPGGGTDENGQTFTYTISSDNPGLFLVGPAIDASGTLTYTLNANVNGSATVTVSVRDSGGTADGGVDTAADQTFDIVVGAVNDQPSFSTLGDQNVLEDSGPHTVAGFAAALPGGGTDESGQTFTYTVSSDNPGLFLVGPQIDASGTLTYTLNANANGSATVTVSVTDSGGTTDGGVDTAADQTFDIVVGAVNDAPSFSTLGDQNVLEDSGPHTVAGFALALPGGGTDESGQTFTYTVSSDNPGLFLVGPQIDASGTLTYTLNANANGSATVTVSVTDSGGTTDGGVDTAADQTFDIIVGAVNDAPSFSTLGDQNVLEDSGPHTVAGFASALPGGGTDESGQTFTYTVSSDNPGLFLVGPAIDASGTLTYTLNANLNGTARITVAIADSGGTANGGVDASADQAFDIIVGAVNDAPSFSTLGDQNVLEDSGPHTVAGFASALPGGGTDESGQTFTYTVSSDNPGLFLVGPAIDASGTLTYTLNANLNGTARITVAIADSGGTGNGGVDASADQAFDIIVGAVNDAPSFSALGDQNVLEDSGPHTMAGFATALPGGGTDESGQTFTYTVSSDNPSLFLVGPAIDASGTLTYTLNANLNGTARITVAIADSGGTGNGGVDTSADQTFDIVVGAVNDAPSFSTLGDQNVLEDSGLHTVAGFATALPGGGTDESGQTFTYTVSSDNPGLFVVGPSIDSGGTLIYTLQSGVTGSATVTVTVTDSGGTTNGGGDTSAAQAFDIVVTPLNAAPLASNLDQAHVYIEDSGPVALHDILVNVGGGNGLITATLTLSDTATGLLSTDSGNGETYSPATGVWTVTGTVAEVNSALAAVVFVPVADNDVSAALVSHVQNAAGQAPADGLITLSVTPVNDAPAGADSVIVLNGDSTLVLAMSDFGFSDAVENDAPLGVQITSLSAASGLLTLGGELVAAGDIVSVKDIDAGLLRFSPAQDLDRIAYATLAFRVQDAGGTLAGGIDFDLVEKVLTFVINPALDAIAGSGITDLLEDESDVPAPTAPAADESTAGDASAADSPARTVNESDDVSTDRISPRPVQVAALGPIDLAVPDVIGLRLFGNATPLPPAAPDAAIAAQNTDAPTAGDRESVRLLSATRDDIELGLNQMRDAVDEDRNSGQFTLERSAAAVLGLSVGYVSWILRGGALLSSVLSSLPVWRFIDPLPVFARERDQQSADGDHESLAGIVQSGGRIDEISAPESGDDERDLPQSSSPNTAG